MTLLGKPVVATASSLFVLDMQNWDRCLHVGGHERCDVCAALRTVDLSDQFNNLTRT
jgi:hypothetical protein